MANKQDMFLLIPPPPLAVWARVEQVMGNLCAES